MLLTNEIALTMIVRNCAEELETCLRSAQPFFDHLFITDTGSQDETLDVAKQFGAHISHYKYPSNWPHLFLDDFSRARNVSLGLVPKNIRWISWLDSDDILVNGIELRQFALNLNSGGRTGILVDYKNQAFFPDRVRLWTNGTFFWEGRIHEEVASKDQDKVPLFIFKNAHVYHNRHDSVVGDHDERDIFLLRLDNRDKPSIQNSYQLACFLYRSEQWKNHIHEIVNLFHYVINRGDSSWLVLDKRSTYKLALIYLRLGNYKKALKYAQSIARLGKKYERYLFYQNTLKLITKISGLKRLPRRTLSSQPLVGVDRVIESL